MTNKYDTGEQLQFKIEERDDPRTWSDEIVPDCEKIINIDAYTQQYWEMALYIVNLWSGYRGRCKLYNTASNERTKHRVRNVLDKYYKGNLDVLMRATNQDAQELQWALESFADICAKVYVKSIDWGWLESHITDGKDAASYRGKIQRRLAKVKTPVSLCDL